MTVDESPASIINIDLTAVVVMVADGEPYVLVLRDSGGGFDALPFGPLQKDHGTLQAGMRSWVERRTQHRLGYIEQLYTFGDRPPWPKGLDAGTGGRTLSLAYLALVQEAHPSFVGHAAWRSWYDYFPLEDWREGTPAVREPLLAHLEGWSAAAGPRGRTARAERIGLTFGLSERAWDDERALERYELLYEAKLVPEARSDAGEATAADIEALAGRPMIQDHRRIVATAISRLRGKIKYRPVLFELLPEKFTLLQLQRTAEALSGMRLHKQNFRRLVEQQRLVEETGEMATDTGGRPAKLMRFRREVTLERPAPGVRVTATRRAGYP
ncbi:MAG: hypothetical protein CMM50_17730 [Rhodospirillaceae bacterium]|nr:hypothetical protein [Rhodospirillaceae bacterium]